MSDNETSGDNLDDLTVDQLRAELDARGIDHKATDRKADLITRIVGEDVDGAPDPGATGTFVAGGDADARDEQPGVFIVDGQRVNSEGEPV